MQGSFPTTSKQNRSTMEESVPKKTNEVKGEMTDAFNATNTDNKVIVDDLQFEKKMEIAQNESTSKRPLDDADTPSPIKVLRNEGMMRQPNWSKFERVKLLSHILKYMEDPTRGRDRGGVTKTDLATNVLSKVSPHLDKNPAEARKLDELTTQYYRTGHPTDNGLGMQDWLRERLESDGNFNVKYLKENRKSIVEDYDNVYNRYH